MSKDDHNKKKVTQVIKERKQIADESFTGADYINLPNLLSITRIFLAYPALCLLSSFHFLAAICLHLVSFLTDLADGWTARKLNIVTEFGAKIDPTTDKAYVITVILALHYYLGIFSTEWFGLDLGISKLNLLVIFEGTLFSIAWFIKPIIISFGYTKKIGSNLAGKSKMTFECIALTLGTLSKSTLGTFNPDLIALLADYSLDIALILSIGSIIFHLILKNDNALNAKN